MNHLSKEWMDAYFEAAGGIEFALGYLIDGGPRSAAQIGRLVGALEEKRARARELFSTAMLEGGADDLQKDAEHFKSHPQEPF